MKNVFFWDGLQHSPDFPEEPLAFVFQKTEAASLFETSVNLYRNTPDMAIGA
jgi:hypothetical protein